MRSKPQSIQKILSSYFIIIMLVMLSCAAFIFSLIQYINLRSNAERDIQRTCSAIAEDIDQQFAQMDNVCLNTIHSTSIKNTFAAYNEDSKATPYEQNQRKNKLANAMTAIKGVDSSIRQVNIYGFTKGSYGAGNYTGDLQLTASAQPWFTDTVLCHGHRYIPQARINPTFSANTGTNSNRYYLSLYRMYYDEYLKPAGFVEIMKYYDVLFRQAYAPNSSYDLGIMVYDTDGNLLFPLKEEGDVKAFSYFSHKSAKGQEVFNTQKNTMEYTCFSEAEYSGFTVAVAVNRRDFLAPVYHSLLWIFFIFVLLFIVCLIFATAISKKISAPIQDIYHFLSHIDPQNQFREIEMNDSGIIEIEKLCNSLNEALRSQKTATDSMLLLKEQELQAQMLALQSQMNPHFLYNSLLNIAAMAEEGLTTPVVQMCQDISSILRYISSNREQVSTVEEELEHCSLYLKCMKLRFGDSLQYEFNVDDAMLDCSIPKLCIQLLVENAAKFSTQVSPPWHVLIRGYTDEANWYIEVKDNGPGFDAETNSRLRSQMDEILKYGLLPSLELNGMGILNIFIRLYLIYGIPFIFDFGNLSNGGAFVKVGGKLNDETKAL
ncbi:sensor histidine kinase [Muricomes intestini]|uniref:Histidine kinase n=1 Tax=Muricomes intestini TaxID=1796634 RepID=A0A4R3K2D6_9FIRM|nr:histidine kinase [Muricomes intestini]TCS76419.1 histidine kinase [Muricomes intestini]